jgi:hypothetical protein
MAHGGGRDIDILSIDVDGLDYELLSSLKAYPQFKPAVIIVESNAFVRPDLRAPLSAQVCVCLCVCVCAVCCVYVCAVCLCVCVHKTHTSTHVDVRAVSLPLPLSLSHTHTHTHTNTHNHTHTFRTYSRISVHSSRGQIKMANVRGTGGIRLSASESMRARDNRYRLFSRENRSFVVSIFLIFSKFDFYGVTADLCVRVRCFCS